MNSTPPRACKRKRRNALRRRPKRRLRKTAVALGNFGLILFFCKIWRFCWGTAHPTPGAPTTRNAAQQKCARRQSSPIQARPCSAKLTPTPGAPTTRNAAQQKCARRESSLIQARPRNAKLTPTPGAPTTRNAAQSMTPVGFEPTQLALVELESTPLDHSGKVSMLPRGPRVIDPFLLAAFADRALAHA